MELHAGVAMFRAGRIAPPALVPPGLAGAAAVLWFRPLLAFPGELLPGAAHGAAAVAWGFAMQLVWLGLWALAGVVAWRRGIVKYGAVGG